MASYNVNCSGCGEPFEARRSSAKWCSDRCRKAKGRMQPAATDAPPPEPIDTGLVDSVRTELEEAGVCNTFAGQLALQLARKMSAVDATGVAGLSKELRAVMTEALEERRGDVGDDAEDADDDPVARAEDELARKRAALNAG